MKPNFLCSTSLALQNLANKSGDVWASLLCFLYITSEVNSTMRHCFFSNLTFFEQKYMQFFKICKTNCTHSIIKTIEARASFAQQIIALATLLKRFHEENSIMSALFSQNNLLLCGIQGDNGLLAKCSKTFQNHLFCQPVLTFYKCQICRESCRVFEQHKKKINVLFLFLI